MRKSFMSRTCSSRSAINFWLALTVVPVTKNINTIRGEAARRAS
eukprot:CAMPEP_0119279104 /NCGR_PEP_ID=MMETSP1329-20130426/20226_1 /TAXON_ID=114041 /ORGANISM="Genus nov. species nov., Strain RCC1024" /LENGTH=43 /DNA_ID= /DNA_START= /DNA_END= /DNA_ORIENTATION=